MQLHSHGMHDVHRRALKQARKHQKGAIGVALALGGLAVGLYLLARRRRNAQPETLGAFYDQTGSQSGRQEERLRGGAYQREGQPSGVDSVTTRPPM